MKNMSVKKIVLYSIGLFGAIMLLIGLCFNVVSYDLNMGKAVSSALSQVGMSANGFTLLSFEVPATLSSMFYTRYSKDLRDVFQILFGVFSYITLTVSILGIFFVVYGFFKNKKGEKSKTVLLFLLLGVIISFIYSVLSIVFVAITNEALGLTSESLESTLSSIASSGKFTTSVFVSLIFQAVCLVAYIICQKNIKSVDNTIIDNKAENTNCESAKKANENDVKEKIDGIIEAEHLLTGLLREYKALYDDSVISSADFMDKKVKLIKTAATKIKQEIAGFINKASFGDIVKAESEMIKILCEYKELLTKGIISDADYTEKKVVLLNCIID